MDDKNYFYTFIIMAEAINQHVEEEPQKDLKDLITHTGTVLGC